MKPNEISGKEQKCISACILKHWSGSNVSTDDENKYRDYEQCLANCNVCE